jgi:hypothetical protein
MTRGWITTEWMSNALIGGVWNAYNICELDDLTTKIITLLEFFNFVSEVSRFQYEWSSGCWCIWKSFGLMRVFNEEMYFHFIGEVFLYSFLRIFRGYLWLRMRVSWSISIRRDRIRALLSLPRLALRAEKFQELHDVPWMLGCETGQCM